VKAERRLQAWISVARGHLHAAEEPARKAYGQWRQAVASALSAAPPLSGLEPARLGELADAVSLMAATGAAGMVTGTLLYAAMG
jgi:hypothetical protein